MRVLLVDDEKEFVATLAERLSMRGIDVEWVTSGEEALQRAAAGAYDLAILDVKMPRIGGIALKKQLHEMLPLMKFIFMTGHGSEQDFKTAISQSGVEYYLIKPVPIDTLIGKIHEVMAKKQGDT